MGEMCVDLVMLLFDTIGGAKEFWSAIAGAIVGGVIAYAVQIKALREGRNQREEDRWRVQSALANALQFKMIRIHSDVFTIHQHVEESFKKAPPGKTKEEAWQFVLPFANTPDAVHFSSDEMGMLLGLKDDDTFNLVFQMDVVHNSLVDIVKAFGAERKALTERMKIEEAKGNSLVSTLDQAQWLALQPQIIAVTSLIDGIRSNAEKDFKDASEALQRLNRLFQEKSLITFKLVSTVVPDGLAPNQETSRA